MDTREEGQPPDARWPSEERTEELSPPTSDYLGEVRREGGPRRLARTRRSVVLVHGNPVALGGQAEYLRAMGYEVRTASTLVEFESVLTSFRPELVLTDTMLARAEGHMLLRGLRAHMGATPVPVAFFSGMSVALLRRLATNLGADGWLSKRWAVGKLAAAIDSLCRQQ